MITEVSIRFPKKPRRLVYGIYPRIPTNTPLPLPEHPLGTLESSSTMIQDFQQTTVASIGLLAQANTVSCGNPANRATMPPRPSQAKELHSDVQQQQRRRQ